jgi:hypothetical protein
MLESPSDAEAVGEGVSRSLEVVSKTGFFFGEDDADSPAEVVMGMY